MLFGNQTVRSRPQNSHSSQLKLLTRPGNLLPRGFVIMGSLVLIPQEEQVDCLVSLLKPPIASFPKDQRPSNKPLRNFVRPSLHYKGPYQHCVVAVLS
jgi:hypothetical protein